VVRALATAIAVALWLGSAPSARADTGGVATAITAAAEALRDGAFSRAAELAGRLAEQVGGALEPEHERKHAHAIPRSDRAEVWRILGLARFFEGELVLAEAALLEFLKLERDARLDPALVPPEAIVFLEDLRLRHADEIRAFHPAPSQRRWLVLNLLPPAGQFQNGERRKGFTLAASGAVLLGVNLGSYARLTRLCSVDEGCQPYGQARLLQGLNAVSLAGLAAVYAYGVYDGFAGYRAQSRSIGVAFSPSGSMGVAVLGRF
jgi:hypothetical protein